MKSVFGARGFFHWRDAATPYTVRKWRDETRGVLTVHWSGWKLIRVFGFRVALIQEANPW